MAWETMKGIDISVVLANRKVRSSVGVVDAEHTRCSVALCCDFIVCSRAERFGLII